MPFSFNFTFSFGNLNRPNQLKTSWSKKMAIKREKQLMKAFEQELKDAKAKEEEVIFLHQTKLRLRRLGITELVLVYLVCTYIFNRKESREEKKI